MALPLLGLVLGLGRLFFRHHLCHFRHGPCQSLLDEPVVVGEESIRICSRSGKCITAVTGPTGGGAAGRCRGGADRLSPEPSLLQPAPAQSSRPHFGTRRTPPQGSPHPNHSTLLTLSVLWRALGAEGILCVRTQRALDFAHGAVLPGIERSKAAVRMV